MKNIVSVVITLMLTVYLNFTVTAQSAEKTLSGTDYFPVIPGYSMKYSVNVVNGKDGITGTHWLTFQPPTDDSIFSFIYSTDGVFTGVGRYFKQGGDFYFQSMRNISGYNPRILDLLALKKTFSNNSEYSDFNKVKYRVTVIDEVTISISFDASNSEYQDLRGQGVILLKKNIGIQKITFEHSASGMFGEKGTTVTFELLNAKQVELCKYYGILLGKDANPLKNGGLALGTFWLNQPNIDKPVAHVDVKGYFDFSVYSDKDIPIMFSYGTDSSSKWKYDEQFKTLKISDKNIWKDRNCDLGSIVY